MDALRNPVPAFANRPAAAQPRPPAPVEIQGSRVTELAGLAAVFAQVALIALIMRNVGLEPLAFRRVVYIAAVGFVINHLLPLRFRPRFFTTLSLCSMVVILGGTIDSRIPDLALGLVRTGTILAVGAMVIGLCHLPIGFWSRVALLVVAGCAIAIFRAGLWESGGLAVVWPVLASMLMFRAIVYLYDLATSPQRATWSHAGSYFFLFPNVCALLFPVVDFRTFWQKYYDEQALVIYQRGAKWMARGVLHLLLYRVVDRLFMLEATAVTNGAELVQFVVCNLFLYLKVSGVFHLVVGMLLLFGYNLPETNHRYFLASSFTDYWRRVNIYWRNFIMKVFYYPTFFRFKRWGQTRALVIATLWSFLVTWALHLYQTWWIKGEVAWSWPDTLFWTSLALLVLANSLWELKRNRQRKLTTGHYSAREAMGLAVRTAATFTVIAVLWSLWSTPTVGLWWHLWSLADWSTVGWGALVLASVMLGAIGFEVLPNRGPRIAATSKESHVTSRQFRLYVLYGAVPLLVLYSVVHPQVQLRLAASGSAGATDLNALFHVVSEKDSDARGQGRGYYENLTSQDEGAGQYFEMMNPGQGRRYSQPTGEVEGVHFRELIPGTQFKHHDWSFATNRWGMRDRDYELTKPAGSVRIAMLGSSQVMGYGLRDDEVFEAAIEKRLNTEHSGKGGFEILNFAVGGMSPLGQVWLLQARVRRFQPDFVVFIAHPNDLEWSNRDVVRTLRKRFSLPPAFPLEIFDQARVRSSTPEPFAVTRLRPFESRMLAACYQSIVDECRRMGAVPVYVFLPVPMDLPLDEKNTAMLLRLAAEAGFSVVDFSGIFSGHEPNELTLKDQGRHINAEGHSLIARELFDRLISDTKIDLFGQGAGISRQDNLK